LQMVYTTHANIGDCLLLGLHHRYISWGFPCLVPVTTIFTDSHSAAFLEKGVGVRHVHGQWDGWNWLISEYNWQNYIAKQTITNICT
jgi:hypothetical protein